MQTRSILELSTKERRKLIDQATQKEEDRAHNPQRDRFFEDQQWLDFTVYQDGTAIRLHTYRQIPPLGTEVKAVLLLFHGLNSHINHGGHIAHELAAHGIMTAGFDYRGFGKSQGVRGYIQSFELHMEDNLKFFEMMTIQLAKLQLSDRPIFLAGLSLGGLTALTLCTRIKEKIKGCILMAPALKPVIGDLAISVVSAIGYLMPKTGLAKNNKPVANRNPTVTEYIRADPYAFNDKPPMGTLKSLLNAMKGAETIFAQMTTPFVVVMGGRDKLVDLDFVQQLMHKSHSDSKQFWFYEDMWHNIWHEPQIDQIILRMITWINERIRVG